MDFEIPRPEEENIAEVGTEKKDELEQWEKELIEKVNRIKTGESLAEAKFTDESAEGLEKKSEFKKTEEGILLRKTVSTINKGEESEPIIYEFTFNNKEQLISKLDSEHEFVDNRQINEEGFIEKRKIWDTSFEELKKDSEKDIASKRANFSEKGFSDVEIERLTLHQKAVTLRNILEDEDDFGDKIEELENKGIIEKKEK